MENLRLNTPVRPAHSQSQKGFSLVEVMIGFMVFSILALSLTATALHTLRSAQLNIMRNTAFATAQGFLEQLKSIPESSIRAALADPEGTPLPTRSVSAAHASGINHIDSPLYLDDPHATAQGSNHRKILLDLREQDDGSFSEVTMDMWFKLEITPLSSSRGYLIEIEFSYESPGIDYVPPQRSSVRIIRSGGSSNS